MLVELIAEDGRFAALAQDWLAQHPLSTNVIGTELAGVLDGTRARSPDAVWVVVRDGADVVGAAMHTPPFPPYLPRLPAGAPSRIAAALLGAGRTVGGVNGETAAVAEFAEQWRRSTGLDSTTSVAERLYVLGSLTPPVGVPGRPRPAVSGDVGLLAHWLATFAAEALPDAPAPDAADQASRRVAAGLWWLWELDARPVSLAGRTAPVAGVARIGPVFTPPEHRRHGYGAAVTARAARAALEAGARHVCLYTDLANPTSNAIYQDIGFRA